MSKPDYAPDVFIVQTLRETIGSAFDRLSELERLILATAAAEQVTTHNRIMEISTDHTYDLTQAFHRLVKAGWLKSNGHGRGTVYHLPGQSLPTPNQVFGEADPVISPSSEHSQRTKQGWLNVAGLANPLIDDLKLLTQDIRQELQVTAQKAQDKKRIPREEMEKIILALCDGHYLTLQVLALLVQRTPDALRQQYLKQLVEQGKLGLAFPTTPTHPQQAYTACKKWRHMPR